jgi:hypothetical protein
MDHLEYKLLLAIGHPAPSKLLSKLMVARNLPVPPEGRTVASICTTDLSK